MRIKFFIWVLWASLLFQFFSAEAQIANPFKLRYHAEQNGGIVYVSNSIVSCENCDAVNEVPPAGKGYNNLYEMRFIDVDSSPETFNSSSADLNLPDCSSVTFAGLYWGGSLSAATPRLKERNKIKLKLPASDAYLDLEADEVWKDQCFKDITSLVTSNAHVNGTFFTANVVVDAGVTNVCGGWTIVVVYKQELMPLRNLSVFDGLAQITVNSGQSFNISGFSTPPVGPVDMEFGFVAYEGDRNVAGDYLAINEKKIFDNAHAANNTFNSSITHHGSVVSTRNPAYNNTLGYDASIIRLNNKDYQYLGNGATVAPIVLRSNEEWYSVGVLTAAIDVYNPSFVFSHQYRLLNPADTTLKAGEGIELEYDLKNTGNDKSTATVFSDAIPDIMEYVPGSLMINDGSGSWTALSETEGDDQGEYLEEEKRVRVHVGTGYNTIQGGSVMPGGIVKIRYRARMRCEGFDTRRSPGAFSKNAVLQYAGNFNAGLRAEVLSAPAASSGHCIGRGPMVIPYEVSSAPPEDNSLTLYCPVNVADLDLPEGYSLYREEDVGFEYPLTMVKAETANYKAHRVCPTGCELSFNIRVNGASIAITAQPAPRKIVEGKSAEFSVATSGPDVKYQWQEDRGHDSWVDIPGATDRVLTLRNVPLSKNRSRYRALVSNPCGQELVSYAVLLNVVESEEGTLFVPNAFKPNSAVDELTRFVVKGRKMSRWQMRVYNKWDQLIWETNRLNPDGSPAEAWDGKIGGQDAPQDIYLWAISAVFCDGSEWQGMSFNQAPPKKTGIVYLIR
ncbi:hypothetical protein [Arcticibacter tournemirensis]